MEKAFDCIPRRLLWKITSEPPYSVPRKLVRVTKSIYNKNLSKVRESDIGTDRFDVKTGVRQGDGLSPLQFIIFMDKCIRDTNSQQSQQVLAYADDVTVVVATGKELQNVPREWAPSMKNNGMKLNAAKRKTEFGHIIRTRKSLTLFNIWKVRGYIRQSRTNTL